MPCLFLGVPLLSPGHASCLSLRRMTLELPTLLTLAETEASCSPKSGVGETVCILVLIFSSQPTVTLSFISQIKKKMKTLPGCFLLLMVRLKVPWSMWQKRCKNSLFLKDREERGSGPFVRTLANPSWWPRG